MFKGFTISYLAEYLPISCASNFNLKNVLVGSQREFDSVVDISENLLFKNDFVSINQKENAL